MALLPSNHSLFKAVPGFADNNLGPIHLLVEAEGSGSPRQPANRLARSRRRSPGCEEE